MSPSSHLDDESAIRMLSVVATCRQQGVNVLDYLTRCYQAILEGKPAASLRPYFAIPSSEPSCVELVSRAPKRGSNDNATP